MSANVVELGSERRGPPGPVQEGRSMHTAIDGAPADLFGTAGIRRRVLAAWSADPARFREDANAEEDLVRGGYRDRLLVELAQNAADAAVRAGMPGRLRLDPPGETRRAANTGAPLDAAGVQGLATLRASAKRDEAGSVGRFGVGFAPGVAGHTGPAGGWGGGRRAGGPRRRQRPGGGVGGGRRAVRRGREPRGDPRRPDARRRGGPPG